MSADAIPVARLQDILRSIYAYEAVHLRHTAREQRACGCDRFTWIQGGADVPEYDPELTAAGWERERGPARVRAPRRHMDRARR